MSPQWTATSYLSLRHVHVSSGVTSEPSSTKAREAGQALDLGDKATVPAIEGTRLVCTKRHRRRGNNHRLKTQGAGQRAVPHATCHTPHATRHTPHATDVGPRRS